MFVYRHLAGRHRRRRLHSRRHQQQQLLQQQQRHLLLWLQQRQRRPRLLLPHQFRRQRLLLHQRLRPEQRQLPDLSRRRELAPLRRRGRSSLGSARVSSRACGSERILATARLTCPASSRGNEFPRKFVAAGHRNKLVTGRVRSTGGHAGRVLSPELSIL